MNKRLASFEHFPSNDDGYWQLARRERECLRMTAQFRTSREIAEQLGIAPQTVDNYIRAARIKLGAADRRQAIAAFVAAEAAVAESVIVSFGRAGIMGSQPQRENGRIGYARSRERKHFKTTLPRLDVIPLPLALAGVGLLLSLPDADHLSSWAGLATGLIIGLALIVAKAAIAAGARSAPASVDANG